MKIRQRFDSGKLAFDIEGELILPNILQKINKELQSIVLKKENSGVNGAKPESSKLTEFKGVVKDFYIKYGPNITESVVNRKDALKGLELIGPDAEFRKSLRLQDGQLKIVERVAQELEMARAKMALMKEKEESRALGTN